MEQIQKLGHRQFVKYLGAASVLSLVAAACGGMGSSATSTTVGSSSATSTVSASENSALGQKIIVDSSGETLYLFEKDTEGKSLCTGGCATAWPPLLTKGKVQAGTGVSASLLGTIKRGNGDMQVTYNGHPLYTFSGDVSSGQTNGEGSTAFGAPWYAVSILGSAVIAKTTSTGGGSAYGYAASPSTTATSGIPQGNGGDQDIDNNGGSSDADGNI
ncbi:MAG: hypothetical protein M0T78_02735 [Actinomycetota bacterium]|nr:hypothetical protein [Actinomycetota bacterium]